MATARKSEAGKSASTAPPKRLALSDKTSQAVLVDTEVRTCDETLNTILSSPFSPRAIVRVELLESSCSLLQYSPSVDLPAPNVHDALPEGTALFPGR